MTHTGERPFVCHVCDRGFNRRGDLKRHLLVHSKEKPHECPDCGERFARASNLANHRRLQHMAQSVRCHVWPECGKGFTTRTHLASHLLTHTGQKPHECSECGTRFAQPGSTNRSSTAASAGCTTRTAARGVWTSET
ncbi:hypothetical protein HPB49_004715 [Dermacentor silvarum]|uniref:Uncharacterized protein n=1 Tax=Dermacentor silvarum TaxID=543639 RepID=A0ACB8DUI7_DERSI|nr:zinc finger protein 771 [Dermacentor silvarum]KAH7978167.1 hypothetical protein HPB49_004715 [Dermacentor silvarum]